MMNDDGVDRMRPLRGSGLIQAAEPNEDSVDTLERLRAENRELRKAIHDQCQSLRKENEILSDCLNGREHPTYG